MFERQFGTSFETYVNSAMQDGIDYEDFARLQYEKITGEHVRRMWLLVQRVFCGLAGPDGF